MITSKARRRAKPTWVREEFSALPAIGDSLRRWISDMAWKIAAVHTRTDLAVTIRVELTPNKKQVHLQMLEAADKRPIGFTYMDGLEVDELIATLRTARRRIPDAT